MVALALTGNALLLALLVLFVVLYIAFIYSQRLKDPRLQRIFWFGLLTKIFGALAISFAYLLYYGGSDVFNFWVGGGLLLRLGEAHPEHFWSIFFGNLQALHQETGLLDDNPYLQFWVTDSRNLTMLRILAPLTFLSGGSVFGAIILGASIFFMAFWSFYIYFQKLFGIHRWYLAIALFATPALATWTSDLMKEAVCTAALLTCMRLFHRMAIEQRVSLGGMVLFLVCANLILLIKTYLLMLALPVWGLWLYLHYVSGQGNVLLKLITAPVLGLGLLAASYVLVTNLSAGSKRFSTENLLVQAEAIQSDLSSDYYYTRSQGSRYEITPINAAEPTTVLVGLPLGLFTTLFRPFPWEANNPLFMLAALESMLIFFLSLRAGFLLFNRQIRRAFFRKEIVVFLTYALILFAILGIISGNFGNLVRYKTPGFVFYCLSLAYVYSLHAQRTAKLRATRAASRQKLAALRQAQFEHFGLNA